MVPTHSTLGDRVRLVLFAFFILDAKLSLLVGVPGETTNIWIGLDHTIVEEAEHFFHAPRDSFSGSEICVDICSVQSISHFCNGTRKHLWVLLALVHFTSAGRPT